MKNVALSVFLCLSSCSSKPEITGRRIFLAGGNISLVLPDSALSYGKPFLWGACTINGAYDETGANYFSPDSTTRIFISVKAMSDNYLQELSWSKLADIQFHKRVIEATNQGQAVIQQIATDSLARTFAIDYSIPKRAEKGWRRQAEFTKTLTIYGKHRRLQFSFSAPDTKSNRQSLLTSRTTLIVRPSYLAETVKPYGVSASKTH